MEQQYVVCNIDKIMAQWEIDRDKPEFHSVTVFDYIKSKSFPAEELFEAGRRLKQGFKFSKENLAEFTKYSTAADFLTIKSSELSSND